MHDSSDRLLADVSGGEATDARPDPEAVRAAFDAPDPVDRSRAVRACERLADDVSSVQPFVDRLAAALDDDSLAVVRPAVSVLHTVAETDPAALEGSIDAVVDAVDTDLPGIQLACAETLSMVVADRPERGVPHADRLVDVLRRSEPGTDDTAVAEAVADRETRRTVLQHQRAERRRREQARSILGNVVVAAAEETPSSLYGSVADLQALVADPDPTVTGCAIDALAAVAAEDPTRLAPADGSLVDCLDHEDPTVRARAVRLYGHLGDDAFVPALRRVADGDPDEQVAELAADTAAYLSE